MKKLLILSLIIGFIFYAGNYANAYETKSSDYEIVTVEDQNVLLEQAEVVKETDNYKILKNNDKYAFYSKKKNDYLIGLIVDSYEELGSSGDEFKFRVKDYIGYLNTDINSIFIGQADDIILSNKYLKVKKDGKYGLIDKNGNLILSPKYDKISIIDSNGEEYISAKQDGKYRIFKNTGELIPEDKLYTVTYDGNYALAKDIMPMFKIAYINNKTTLYERADYQSVFEIQELELPKKVKVSELSKEIKNAEPVNKSNEIVVNKKNFILIGSNGNFGLSDKNGKVIIPEKYSELKVIKPCEHFKKSLIFVKEDNNKVIYDIKGKVIAQGNADFAEIKAYGKTYNYIYDLEQNNWILTQNEKEIGTLTLLKNKYEFQKSGFHIRSLHKINELLLALINS